MDRLQSMRVFAKVVEQGSFRKAADTVRISQPALSRRIEKLEDALLMADAASRREGASVLPDADILIVDEAHHLATVASLVRSCSTPA